MSVLRERLKELNPKLFQAFERSWDNAWNEWLPALGVQNDSYNSYPHIRNLENYLDQVFLGLYGNYSRPIELTDIEIYLMLNAILFHDIGRIHGSDHHGIATNEIINKYWHGLGIASYQLAKSLGRICEYHDTTPEQQRKLNRELNNIVIDPYGEVRERSLASLLVLVDHLDSAFTRVLPYYLQSDSNIKVIGAFRRVVIGVHIDHYSQMIRTVLNNEMPSPDKDEKEKIANIHFSANPNRIKEFNLYLEELYEEKKKQIEDFRKRIEGWVIDKPNVPMSYGLKIKWDDFLKSLTYETEEKKPILYYDPHEISNFLSKNLKKFNLPKTNLNDNTFKADNISWKHLFSLSLSRSKKKGDFYKKYIPLIQRVNKDKVKKGTFDSMDWLVAQQILFAEKKDEYKDKYWPIKTLLAMIMGNIRENEEALARIKDNIAAMGIPIRAWLIEYKEHLYNCLGQETFEPIFTQTYLNRIVKCMWELSTQVFGVSYFSYEALASQVREPDTKKIIIAVRRIGIIVNETKKEELSENNKIENDGNDHEENLYIWVGDFNWRWVVKTNKEGCEFAGLKEIETIINNLGKPIFDSEIIGFPEAESSINPEIDKQRIS